MREIIKAWEKFCNEKIALRNLQHEDEWITAFLSTYKKADGWIAVSERPLYTKDENGHWICTEDGDGEFWAAVPFTHTSKPNEIQWWIRHCVVEDERGLCVVGDSDNEPAGWELEHVEYFMPINLPPPPTTNKQ